MKNILNTSLNIKCLILVLCCFSSCTDLLEEETKSLAVETFYNTAAEVETAVNAIYSPLRSTRCLSGLYLSQLESYTDYCYGNGSYAVLNEFQGLNSTNINRVGNIWDQFYLSIRNANLVIANAPLGNDISSEDIDRFVGEAKFLRALTYFYLVRNWGGVPLRTIDNMSQIDLPRASESAVYDLILSDLIEAESTLPNEASNIGRPTLWSAKALLSHVYLQLERFSEAASKADEVIQSGIYSLIPVTTVEDFQDIFGPDITNSTEEIFYLKFIRQNNQGYQWCMFVNDAGTQLHGAGGFTSHWSDRTNYYFSNWDNSDLRKSLWFNWDINRGPDAMLSQKIIDPLAISASGAGNDNTIYRYSDVLLIFAEAATREAGMPTVSALEALNQVHRRAYGFAPEQVSPVDFNITDYNEEQFVDLIIQERGYEFQYEGKRWLDLKRTGKAQQIISMAKDKTISDSHYFWPIPISEMNYNKAIDPTTDQNPGY